MGDKPARLIVVREGEKEMAKLNTLCRERGQCTNMVCIFRKNAANLNTKLLGTAKPSREGYTFECRYIKGTAHLDRVEAEGRRGLVYVEVRPISAKALLDAGACKDELEKFVGRFGYLFKRIPLEDVLMAAKSYPTWLPFLIKEGFVREEVVWEFKRGDKFYIQNEEYMLCACGPKRAVLVQCGDGDERGAFYADSITINHAMHITKEEMEQLIGLKGEKLEKILDSKH